MATSKTALRAYFDALGIPSERADFALPYLTGDKPLPTATEKALAATEEEALAVKTATYTAAAKFAGVSRMTIYRLVKDGTLHAVSIRGKNRVRLAEVIEVFKGKAA